LEDTALNTLFAMRALSLDISTNDQDYPLSDLFARGGPLRNKRFISLNIHAADHLRDDRRYIQPRNNSRSLSKAEPEVAPHSPSSPLENNPKDTRAEEYEVKAGVIGGDSLNLILFNEEDEFEQSVSSLDMDKDDSCIEPLWIDDDSNALPSLVYEIAVTAHARISSGDWLNDVAIFKLMSMFVSLKPLNLVFIDPLDVHRHSIPRNNAITSNFTRTKG
jgi:hypothetical protein